MGRKITKTTTGSSLRVVETGIVQLVESEKSEGKKLRWDECPISLVKKRLNV